MADGGLGTELFDEPVPQALVCPVCLGVLLDPVVACAEGDTNSRKPATMFWHS